MSFTLKFSLFLIVISTLVSPSNLAEQASSCTTTFNVSSGSNWPPYSFEENNVRVGIDIKILEVVLSEANICINYVNTPSSKRALTELEKGNIDLIYAASYNDKRSKYGIYSVPYRQEKMRIFWNPKTHKQLINSNLLILINSKLKVVIDPGSYYGPEGEKILKHEKSKSIFTMDSIEGRMQMLNRNRVDMTIEDELTGLYYLKRNQISDVELHPYVIHQNNVSYLYSKKTVSQQQVEKINNILLDQIDRIQEIIQSYIAE